LAGLITPNDSTAGTESPAMVMTKSDMWSPSARSDAPFRS
jgi:hypothetical protein